jgi:hypothetical protein
MRLAMRIVPSGLVLVLIASIGCSSGKVAEGVAAANSANIKRVGNLYGSYFVHNSWEGPKSEEGLKRYIHDSLNPKKLEMMGIDSQNVDAIFISERDHKPFKVRWGLSVPPLSTVSVVFEQEGVDGKKQVANTNGEVHEVDDAEYQRLWGEKGSAAAPSGPPQEEGAPASAAKQPAAK